MKKLFLSILLFLWAFASFAQSDSTKATNKKYVAWVSPSGATHVYGMMLNFYPRDGMKRFPEYPKIYGAEINLNPIGLFAPFVMAIHSFDPQTHKPPYEEVESVDFSVFKRIYGIQAGSINMEKSIINGLDLNVCGSFDSKTNGLTFSAIMNKHYFVNGLTFAVFGNHDSKCNGVQISLFNSCKDLKGVQLGLWNKNQKRSIPFINWCFE